MKTITHLAFGLLLSASVAFAQTDNLTPKFVDTLVAPYLSIQKGLAADDFATAQTASQRFLEAVKEGPAGDVAKLAAPAQKIAEATDIKQARAAFLPLSREITALVETVGTASETQLYVAHCPMAFQNTGGSWIQADKTIANPYYGSMMLRCGTIQKQATTAPKSSHAH